MTEIPFDRLKQEYHVDYWDGPVSGMATLDKERVWFELFDEDWVGEEEPRRIRKFWLFKPTERQATERDYWHAEFAKYVKDTGGLKPPSEHEKFYQRYKEAKKTFERFVPENAFAIAVEALEGCPMSAIILACPICGHRDHHTDADVMELCSHIRLHGRDYEKKVERLEFQNTAFRRALTDVMQFSSDSRSQAVAKNTLEAHGGAAQWEGSHKPIKPPPTPMPGPGKPSW